MHVYRNIDEVEHVKCRAVTIGTFDGVHLGHREIIGRLNTAGEAMNLRKLVVTFEPHPQIVLKSKAPDIKILTTLEEKLEIMSSLKIDEVLVIEFTKQFSLTGAEQFYRDIMIGKVGMCKLVLGYDHMFGRNREGNFEMMQILSAKYGFEIDRVEEYKRDGAHISSTAVRKLLETGRVRDASALLGSNYALSGTVKEGRRIGRQLGMPTANIEINCGFKLIPAYGIYAVNVRHNETIYGGVMSIGTNPTVTDDRSVKIEVNIMDFDKTIYGDQLCLEFVEYIRSEKKFSSLDELKKQMFEDKFKAQEILNDFSKNKFAKENN